MKDVAFLLAGGEIFALVVYAQLLLENAAIYGIDRDLLDQIFDFMCATCRATRSGCTANRPTPLGRCSTASRSCGSRILIPSGTRACGGTTSPPLNGAYAMGR